MSATGVLAATIVGVIAGWIADFVIGRERSLFIKLLVGVIGAFIGAFAATRIHFPVGGVVGELTVSSLGAVLFLAVLGLFRRSA
ncbi:GlsB/YeaQ/YmgE family stress response membrane protein [Caulobacter segnis]|uniref:GlsB/YeaQ/YmgE family stress response membrane protein n=1 Tax=Caulobacter segnis TaxID=88688 RepID=A0A2W5UVD8_9CAUL|nr:GlsB/YeaQ/YmgE family stress response membrane protein [Caulobacter segnis]PZR30607.1 MAG: GlsB/YeaQ/YmgE family stress response membrane protein [Caulobacter segnis]